MFVTFTDMFAQQLYSYKYIKASEAVTMPTLLSLVELGGVQMTPSNTASEDKVGIMTTLKVKVASFSQLRMFSSTLLCILLHYETAIKNQDVRVINVLS